MTTERINRLALLSKMKEDDKPVISPEQPAAPAPVPIKPQESFNISAAQQYNTKSKQIYGKHEAEVKRLLNTSADWESPEFAQAVYDWQGKNGFSGKWVDGKLGPATMGKMSKIDPELKTGYDAFAPFKTKHQNDKPYSKVVGLMGEVQKVQQQMNATDIPLGMLMGWMQVESGGRVNDVTTSAGFKEMGLFQVSEAEAKAIGADHERLTTDIDYSIQKGIELARYHENNLGPTITQYVPKGSDMYWRLVFLGFSAGDGFVKKMLSQMAAAGAPMRSWDDVMDYVKNVPYIGKHAAPKWVYHVDRAFNLGNQMAPQQSQPTQLAASLKVTHRINTAKRRARDLVLGRIK